jgi:hypothetical protein
MRQVFFCTGRGEETFMYVNICYSGCRIFMMLRQCCKNCQKLAIEWSQNYTEGLNIMLSNFFPDNMGMTKFWRCFLHFDKKFLNRALSKGRGHSSVPTWHGRTFRRKCPTAWPRYCSRFLRLAANLTPRFLRDISTYSSRPPWKSRPQFKILQQWKNCMIPWKMSVTIAAHCLRNSPSLR